MPIERCEQCGFDGGSWSDDDAMAELDRLGARWVQAVAGLRHDDLQVRPFPDMWSIAEYTDHVREVIFAMRFVLDSAVANPGVDLGAAPEPEFTTEPRRIDVQNSLDGITREATALTERLRELGPDDWSATAIFDGKEFDLHWVCRHAAHDALHHLDDVRRLQAAL